MANKIATAIKKAKDNENIDKAKNKYYNYFVVCQKIYGRYRGDVDEILIRDGYSDCIY